MTFTKCTLTHYQLSGSTVPILQLLVRLSYIHLIFVACFGLPQHTVYQLAETVLAFDDVRVYLYAAV
jgi:hypothetical protein